VLAAVLAADALLPQGIGLDDGQHSDVIAYAAILCWALDHPHSSGFEGNLEYMEQLLAKNNFVVEPGGVLHHCPPGMAN
jgi:hypothetical protein